MIRPRGDEGGGRRRQAIIFILRVLEKGFLLFKYLSVESTRTRRSGCRGAQINMKKGAHLEPSNEGERAREARDASYPPCAHSLLALLARREC